MQKKIIFLDTETTGTNDDDVLCQLAYKTNDEVFCELFKPSKLIPPEASAVTHITNKMVAEKPAFKESTSYQKIKSMLEDSMSIMVAHNAKFDLAMIEKESITPHSYICTLRVARALDTENKLSQYKLQYLRYLLDIDVEAQAHDALGDVLVLEKLFERMLKKITEETNGDEKGALQRMIEISSRPSLLRQFNFGKYIGKDISDVSAKDPGYLEWLLSQKEENNPEDEDWIYTLKYHLGKLQ